MQRNAMWGALSLLMSAERRRLVAAVHTWRAQVAAAHAAEADDAHASAMEHRAGAHKLAALFGVFEVS
jgi:hypothetical protein